MRAWDTSQQAKYNSGSGAFYGTGYPVPMLAAKPTHQKGRERKRKIENGCIVVKNPLVQELPSVEVNLKSGRTTYRFTGSYEGQRSLPNKVLRLMERENLQKDIAPDMQSCIGRLITAERSRNYGKAV